MGRLGCGGAQSSRLGWGGSQAENQGPEGHNEGAEPAGTAVLPLRRARGWPGAISSPLSRQPQRHGTFLAEIGGRGFPARQAACRQRGPEGGPASSLDLWTRPSAPGPQPACRARVPGPVPTKHVGPEPGLRGVKEHFLRKWP